MYTYTLSITPDQIARGRDLFNADCADCDVSALTSLDATANLSQNALIAAVADLPGFASLERFATAPMLPLTSARWRSPTPTPSAACRTAATAEPSSTAEATVEVTRPAGRSAGR